MQHGRCNSVYSRKWGLSYDSRNNVRWEENIFQFFDESFKNILHVGTDQSLNALRILSLFLVSHVSMKSGSSWELYILPLKARSQQTLICKMLNSKDLADT